ncbi:uncharacterized protein FOMMEDRAFT_168403 [Fomitiporia mediterranea MF3/22]|uniref:uncharacterized protein n=1 Tax=Fomitiporia mediterranea (strain MF3/22) TaxID=694068 RepID=UPI0004408A78|nr:uncharacterized protein FOMMEDRAFT_168403 [Fomitiporia mediterranea MF3/22]EJD01777.1 hypothetical protein FOMMEDRAFT_168403 [Fomitiporia mediterranea MF3/22]
MTTPLRSPYTAARSRRPHRPLPALPTAKGTKGELVRPSYLVKDDLCKPFKLLESHPLSLICQYHNVKRVSLEEGVPPPSKLDVPIIHSATNDPNAFLPTHVLAVYDQDLSSERNESNPTLSRCSAGAPAGLPLLPATPLMVPVNAELWSLCFSSTISPETIPSTMSSPSLPEIDAARRHSRTESLVSSSSQSSNRSSLTQMRPRSVLSLPVYVVRVPSAQALPLLLLASLRILPKDHVLTALLPRTVLAELPSPPAILAQHLLNWLYPIQEGRERSLNDVIAHTPFSEPILMPRSPLRTWSSRLPPSPSLSPALNTRTDNVKRLSSISASSVTSTNSSAASSFPSSMSLISPSSSDLITPEPTCALIDPTTTDDPDLRLLALAQQNFGVWADALALGVRDANVVKLVDLARSVASEARRPSSTKPESDAYTILWRHVDETYFTAGTNNDPAEVEEGCLLHRNEIRPSKAASTLESLSSSMEPFNDASTLPPGAQANSIKRTALLSFYFILFTR